MGWTVENVPRTVLGALVNVIVLAHPARRRQAEELASSIDADEIIWDHDSRGATANHIRGLEYARDHGRTVVLEDDALPVPDFRSKCARWIHSHPRDLISFYLGTSYPRYWQPIVDERMADIDLDYIVLEQLIHGVSYTIDPALASSLLDVIDHRSPHADFAVGDAWRRSGGRQIIYPVRSLVDHRDEGRIASTRARPLPRRARLLDA